MNTIINAIFDVLNVNKKKAAVYILAAIGVLNVAEELLKNVLAAIQ